MTNSEIVRVDINDVNVGFHHAEIIPTDIDIMDKSTITVMATSFMVSLGSITSWLLFGHTDAFIMAGSGLLFGTIGGMAVIADLKADSVVTKLQHQGYAVSSQYRKKLRKSFLPFNKSERSNAYQIKSKPTTQQIVKTYINSGKREINLDPITYTVHRVKDGIKVYHPIVVNPMDSWDKLYFAETGMGIKDIRTPVEDAFEDAEKPFYHEVMIAKLRMKLHAKRKYDAPILLEEMSKTKIQDCASILNYDYRGKW